MSKELEVLEFLLKDRQKHGYESIGEKNDVENGYNLIKQALQAPTRKEVCNALSEWYSKEYKVDCIVRYMGSFIVETLRGGSQDLVYYDKHSKNIECYLPPYLITMIGKFYENESESNK